jgi:DNA-binding winged helix-turn-helix (wHTH) protein
MTAIVIDPGARVVQRDGVPVHLAPKAFDLLLLLVSSQPNAVPHERLHAALWPGIHVSETSLAALVTQLRKALGDGPDSGHAIRTLHRVGYAFRGEAVITGNATPGPSSRCRLIWHRQAIDVRAGVSVIGRDRACAIHIDAESVSRHHARLIASDDEISIEDLGSKNGTWVKGERIRGQVPLEDGVSFRVGSEVVRLEFADDNRPTKTV